MCPVICFFAVETNLSFWWDLEKFSQKSVPSHTFLRCGDHLKFWIGLTKVSTKMCAQLHVFSLWRLTWVFDGTWKNFHKKVCTVTRFFAVETNLSFWWDLESFDKKVCPVICFFAVKTNLSFWWDLEKFSQKVCPVARFFAMETLLRFWGDLKSFDKKVWPVTHFVRCGDYLKFWMGLRKLSTKRCGQLNFFGSAD